MAAKVTSLKTATLVSVELQPVILNKVFVNIDQEYVYGVYDIGG